jgi:serine/threonine protein kinase
MEREAVKHLAGQQELSARTITYCTELGRGAYAAVYRAKCDELPCAAKILHDYLADPALQLKDRFYQECEHLKSIRHPNIVQYLGLCQEVATKKPVLLMELMDLSLTSFLESSTIPLSSSVQLQLCHDIALALAHLHSLHIIHRDLSSNNVLLIGPGSRAKVSDFGMSRVIDTSKSRHATPLTMVPGTVPYMPPEALGEDPVYSEKLDCFSFGVLVLQVMTRLFPNPSPRTKRVASALSPIGISVPVAETECRKEHIDKINKTNPLLHIAIECLELKMEDRPSASELCHRVEGIKRSIASYEHAPSFPLAGTAESISSDSPQNCVLPACRETKQNYEEMIASLQQQLQSQKNVIDDLKSKIAGFPTAQQPNYGLSIKTWKTGSSAPDIVAKSSSTVFNNTICCCFQNLVYNYDIQLDTWNELPKVSPTDCMSLLVTFHEEMRKLVAIKNTTMYIIHGEWVAQGDLDFIPWATLYHDKYVIFFGSDGQVVVFQFSNDSVYVRSSLRVLPVLTYASVTICNGFIYAVGVNYKQVWTNNVYRIPLCDLLPKSEMPKFSILDRSIFKKKRLNWQELTPLPVPRSTCVAFNNHLLAVGGFAHNQASGGIFLYNEEADKWEVMGRMPTPRYNCLAEIVDCQLVVVGGWLNYMVKCDVIEIADLNVCDPHTI